MLIPLVLSGNLRAQPVSVGIKAGARLTDDLDTVYATSESRPYLVGPTAIFRLPHQFQIEFDALYQRVGFRISSTDITGGTFYERARGNSWEFPLLLRRSIWRGLYGGAGYSPRIINGSGHAVRLSVVSLTPYQRVFSESDVPVTWGATHGVVAVGGIEKRLGRLRIAPEVRYTYWTTPAMDEQGSHGFHLTSSQHQVDVMFGVTFP